MTKHECAIVTLYTGINMLEGDDLKYLYEYASGLIGRPIYTHEFMTLEDNLKKMSRDDFIRLCREAVDG